MLFVPSVVSICVLGSFAFAIAHHDLLIAEVEVFHPQTQAIHEPQAGAVEKRGHEPEGRFESVEQTSDFGRGEDYGQFARPFGPGELAEIPEVQLQNVLVESRDAKGVETDWLLASPSGDGGGAEGVKDEGIECLILGGG